LRPSRFGDVRLNLDPDIGYVEVLGSAGQISGFYHIDPASGRLRWPRLGLGTLGYRVNGVTFDRASGMMSVALRSAPDGLAQLTGTCIAGSTTADGDGRADLPKSSALDSNARADLN
jgi:hypothetical protein